MAIKKVLRKKPVLSTRSIKKVLSTRRSTQSTRSKRRSTQSTISKRSTRRKSIKRGGFEIFHPDLKTTLNEKGNSLIAKAKDVNKDLYELYLKHFTNRDSPEQQVPLAYQGPPTFF